MMLRRAIQAAQKFFVALAASLTGLGATCTAAGFLAEHARWSMLGFAAPTVDLNQYLFTGARFFAFLPGVFLSSVLTAVAESLTVVLGSLVVAVGGATLHRFRDSTPVTAVMTFLRSRWHSLRGAGLLALAVFQFAGALFLFRAAGVGNVLFLDPSGWEGAECGQARLGLAAEIFKGCDEQLLAHLGSVFLVALLSAGFLGLLLRARPGAEAEAGSDGPGRQKEGEDAKEADGPTRRGALGTPALGTRTLAWTNVGLLAVQLVLLPFNYGALFLASEFPVVQVGLDGSGPELERWPDDGRLSLLRRRQDEFYLYASSAGRIWMVPRSRIESLSYLGTCSVFEPFDDCLPREDEEP